MPYKLPQAVLEKLVIKQQYDSNSILKNLFNLAGTSLPGVLTMPLFWCMWVLHVTFFFIVKFANCPVGSDGIQLNLKCRDAKEFLNAEMPLALSDLGLLNTLTAFFIVFYSGNCFARYTAMYGASIAIQGKMHNISLYVRSYFVQPATRWNVIRKEAGGGVLGMRCTVRVSPFR
ncbi:hypothetical protein T484DRAFT_1819318 [Baffinella frigidus]|nr:hypothetical protein T484DRAFT_1819318 [Cryptophyta sp. CCMP2293]